MWEKAKQDPEFRQYLLNYISQTVDECMPKGITDEVDSLRIGHHIFQPLLRPDYPEFDDVMSLNVSDIVRSRHMHSQHHMLTCFKYGSKRCHSRFPRAIVMKTSFDEDISIIQVKRDHA